LERERRIRTTIRQHHHPPAPPTTTPPTQTNTNQHNQTPAGATTNTPPYRNKDGRSLWRSVGGFCSVGLLVVAVWWQRLFGWLGEWVGGWVVSLAGGCGVLLLLLTGVADNK
jgi:hypothetical protein